MVHKYRSLVGVHEHSLPKVAYPLLSSYGELME